MQGIIIRESILAHLNMVGQIKLGVPSKIQKGCKLLTLSLIRLRHRFKTAQMR